MPRAGVSVAAREPRQYDNAIDEVSRERTERHAMREAMRTRSLQTPEPQTWESREPRLRPASDPEPSRAPGAAIPGRRTITIQGRGAERYTPRRRRPPRTLQERSRLRPDRTAMWAVLLGLLLVLAAATSSRAAVSSPAPPAAPSALVVHVR